MCVSVCMTDDNEEVWKKTSTVELFQDGKDAHAI